MWQNGQFSRCNRFQSQQSPVKVVVYNCMHVSIKKSEVSLSLGRGKSGYEIRRVLRRTPTAEVAILTLFRDEHIRSLAFEKSLQISKVIWIRCALFLSEKPSRVYIWEICQKKTKEDETIQIKTLGSSPFIKTSPPWKTKKPRWAGIIVNYEMGAKLFKTETLCQQFK